MAALESGDGITIEMSTEDLVIFTSEQPRAGLVFYSGGKADHRAYTPRIRF